MGLSAYIFIADIYKYRNPKTVINLLTCSLNKIINN